MEAGIVLRLEVSGLAEPAVVEQQALPGHGLDSSMTA